MANFGKPNATGRSSGKLTGRNAQRNKPPKDVKWAWLIETLLASPSWRALGTNARRLMDALILEHIHHAGTENGNLKLTYNQMQAFGLTRNCISEAIEEAEYLGLIKVQRSVFCIDVTPPNVYRLTFYEDKYGNSPTNDWKKRTPEAIEAWKSKRAQKRKLKREGSKNKSQSHM